LFRITRATISPLKQLWSARRSSELVDLTEQRGARILARPRRGRHRCARAHSRGLSSAPGCGRFYHWGKRRRAWTIHAGEKAPAAAGAIHSDFERGFIAAETIHYNDLVAAGSFAKARENGQTAA
jgi:ribosome-binding ATPase YchF (GTP1/OBG family)